MTGSTTVPGSQGERQSPPRACLLRPRFWIFLQGLHAGSQGRVSGSGSGWAGGAAVGALRKPDSSSSSVVQPGSAWPPSRPAGQSGQAQPPSGPDSLGVTPEVYRAPRPRPSPTPTTLSSPLPRNPLGLLPLHTGQGTLVPMLVWSAAGLRPLGTGVKIHGPAAHGQG